MRLTITGVIAPIIANVYTNGSVQTNGGYIASLGADTGGLVPYFFGYCS